MDIHAEHWQEPTAVTAERPEGEKYCESCGEDIPFHNSSCSMLKNAYKRRLGTCTFCKEKHRVGDQMREHVEATHQAELRKLLYGKEN
jgi:CRISPR/Cas system-associated protein Cas10 (large subunit of type III CRISPR-Cas system)